MLHDFSRSFVKKFPVPPLLPAVFAMILFWAVFDGAVGFITPIAITDMGIRPSVMGLMIGSSSLWGVLFDFVLGMFFPQMSFRKSYGYMFLAALAVPVVLVTGSSFGTILLAMALWGLYYDLYSFGNYDFVGREFTEKKHASIFGILYTARSFGLMAAPLLTGFAISQWGHGSSLGVLYVFFACSVFIYLLGIAKNGKKRKVQGIKSRSHILLRRELHVWVRLFTKIYPVLLLTISLNIIDAFFWTLGPMLVDASQLPDALRGIFLTAYELPLMFVFLVTAAVVKKLGKKRMGFTGLLLGSLVFSLIGLFPITANTIVFVLIGSFFFSFSWPAAAGTYADFISDNPVQEREVAGLGDMCTNIGFIIGPILAGLVGDLFGVSGAFTIVGIFGMFAGGLLMLITPKKITVGRV